MIGANFPDIDALSLPFGRALEFRRGWTHGVLALVLLPFVLAGIMLVWDRYARRRHGRVGEPARPRELVLLAALAMLTHPTLDWMNSYGLRWLMPFSGRWFYGDALFIIDPWLLMLLGAGVWLSRRAERRGESHAARPAVIALVLCAVYTGTMLLLQPVLERSARQELASTGVTDNALFVMPAPANPLRWRIVADDGARYWRGSAAITAPPGARVTLGAATIPRLSADPAAQAAARTERGRRFLEWARIPYFAIDRRPESTVVTITDARYGAFVEVVLPPDTTLIRQP